MSSDDFRSPLPPPDPPDAPARPNPAPPWVAFVSAWLGLLTLIGSAIFPFLPGSRDPRAELERVRPYSFADKFLPLPMYGTVIAVFLGIVVLRQMRKEPRPLPEPMLAQRLQAWFGITLALLGAAIIYTWVALRGPR